MYGLAGPGEKGPSVQRLDDQGPALDGAAAACQGLIVAIAEADIQALMADGKALHGALGRAEADLLGTDFNVPATAQGLEQRFFYADVLPQQAFFNLAAPIQAGRLSGQG